MSAISVTQKLEIPYATAHYAERIITEKGPKVIGINIDGTFVSYKPTEGLFCLGRQRGDDITHVCFFDYEIDDMQRIFQMLASERARYAQKTTHGYLRDWEYEVYALPTGVMYTKKKSTNQWAIYDATLDSSQKERLSLGFLPLEPSSLDKYVLIEGVPIVEEEVEVQISKPDAVRRLKSIRMHNGAEYLLWSSIKQGGFNYECGHLRERTVNLGVRIRSVDDAPDKAVAIPINAVDGVFNFLNAVRDIREKRNLESITAPPTFEQWLEENPDKGDKYRNTQRYDDNFRRLIFLEYTYNLTKLGFMETALSATAPVSPEYALGYLKLLGCENDARGQLLQSSIRLSRWINYFSDEKRAERERLRAINSDKDGSHDRDTIALTVNPDAERTASQLVINSSRWMGSLDTHLSILEGAGKFSEALETGINAMRTKLERGEIMPEEDVRRLVQKLRVYDAHCDVGDTE